MNVAQESSTYSNRVKSHIFQLMLHGLISNSVHSKHSLWTIQSRTSQFNHWHHVLLSSFCTCDALGMIYEYLVVISEVISVIMKNEYSSCHSPVKKPPTWSTSSLRKGQSPFFMWPYLSVFALCHVKCVHIQLNKHVSTHRRSCFLPCNAMKYVVCPSICPSRP